MFTCSPFWASSLVYHRDSHSPSPRPVQDVVIVSPHEVDKYPEVLLPLADVQVGPQTDLVAIVGGVEAFGIDEKVVIVPQFLMVVREIIYPP